MAHRVLTDSRNPAAAGRRIVRAGVAAGLVLTACLAHPSFATESPSRDAAMSALLERLADLSSEAAFERPEGPWTLSLPRDHGAHPEARGETWVIAAHLEDAAGRALGVWFSLSRVGVEPGPVGDDGSPWDMRALHLAAFALAGEGDRTGRIEERPARGAGVAGHDPAAREVWVDHWTLAYGVGPEGDGLTLSGNAGDVPIALSMRPVKPARPVDGDGATPFRGFVIPRLSVTGTIGVDGDETRVTGYAWLDRGWGDLPMPGGPLVYDRLQIQFDDGTDLSVVRTRRRDGRGTETLDGLIVDADGRTTIPGEGDIVMSAQSPASETFGTWQVGASDLTLRVTPVAGVEGEGLVVGGRTALVRAEGTRGGVPVTGIGTLRISGADAP